MLRFLRVCTDLSKGVFAVDTVLPVKCQDLLFDLPDHAGALTAVKDKARFRARACGPP
jgi:hypothetical protein